MSSAAESFGSFWVMASREDPECLSACFEEGGVAIACGHLESEYVSVEPALTFEIISDKDNSIYTTNFSSFTTVR